ncbi:hypothetical protein N473_01350 [Pseudoalteromonas luteoviolacea CPMOR-1]|uniref:Phytanoyl-CoA dioxygenase n=1 Tax=Pseudoalteromonas luteoviolacea CPMOR-1 TaxID=1365248 RepID=A0A167LUN5_9GAMM|nr:phytanoyl-CoA dioxygenase family protein [Pseudoalteromonas luteoviolacea]KZN65248.1 hypothetical protein N473_01350 [Pseudoalteromonas luteoviolacea CPMOR-1]
MEQKEFYNKNGYLILSGFLSKDELNDINAHLSDYIKNVKKGVALEADGKTIRGLHGLHLYDDFFKRLTNHPAILDLAKQLLHKELYVHQFKVNLKEAIIGASWPWHQDYIFLERVGSYSKSTFNKYVYSLR